MRKKKILKTLFIVITLLLVITVMAIAVNNTYSVEKENVMITAGGNNLCATIYTPKNDYEKLGTVIIVHGDRAMDADSNGGLMPIFEAIAKKGYAVISWDKPGVGGSGGNWLAQSMEDRAQEVADIIEWVRNQNEYDEGKIGLWGVSQAGWVVPKVAKAEDIDFAILCSPAINWLEQGEYHIKASMQNNGNSKEEVEAEQKSYYKSIELLENGASYEEYLAKCNEENPMNEDRYNFVKLNYLSDSTIDLENFNIPILLALGAEDIKVDSKNTKNVYESILPHELLSIEWIEGAGHGLIKKKFTENNFMTYLVYVVSPRSIFAEEYIAAMQNFLEKLKGGD